MNLEDKMALEHGTFAVDDVSLHCVKAGRGRCCFAFTAFPSVGTPSGTSSKRSRAITPSSLSTFADSTFDSSGETARQLALDLCRRYGGSGASSRLRDLRRHRP